MPTNSVFPLTNLKFVWCICFNFSSWSVQISQIIFFCWPVLKILSHGNFSFHFLNVAFLKSFDLYVYPCCKLRKIQILFLTVFLNLWIKQHSDISLSHSFIYMFSFLWLHLLYRRNLNNVCLLKEKKKKERRKRKNFSLIL